MTDTGDGELELRLSDVRALLGGRLAGRPTRANFRTGTLTVCTMVPMRSVPHRVVCLLGLDDGIFPRAGVVDGDDVLARRPRTGERDGRSEDRQLLLDAVMAATEHLVITYTGANEHSGARRPPAVPLGELLDAADRTTAEPVSDAILTRHPLQAYDPRNLKAGDPSSDPPEWAVPELRGPTQRPFSFDGAALAGARAAAGVRRAGSAAAPRRPAVACRRGPVARRPHPVPHAPGAHVPARPPRRVDAVRARRAQRRHPRPARLARVLADRRQPAQGDAGRSAGRMR